MERIVQTVESAAVISARRAEHNARRGATEAEKAAHRAAHPDSQAVTWGDLRTLGLVDD